MATTITYKGSDLTSFSNTSKTLRTAGKYLEGDITITASADINNQNKTFVPSETSTTITYDSGYTGLGTVTVNGITNTYVGSGVPQRTNANLSFSGGSFTGPSGYYASNLNKNISVGSLQTPTISSSGLVTASAVLGSTGAWLSQTESPKTLQLPVQAATTITPSSATQIITGQKYMTGDITVEPIPSQYIIPSGTLTITSVDTTTTFDATNYASVAVNLKNADVTAY